MSREETHQRFDLSRFVLGFFEQKGSIVTPPTFGVYEVLMPDALAADLNLDSYQHLSFTAGEDPESVQLGYNHPLVEAIAERLIERPANAHVYINHVRLDKTGLIDLARKTYDFPNARLSARSGATQRRGLHHYLRFNFKVALISDEKQELIVSPVMNVQGGYAVGDNEVLERLDSFETTSAFSGLSIATQCWQDAETAISPGTFNALLSRAEHAVREDMADTLHNLQTRMERHLALDRARIADYYDDLERDMRRRRDNLGAGEAEQRRSSAEEKLTALQAERQAKLEDVAGRYQMRLELELVNILLIEQPKILLPITISNRTADITRVVVWDPLVHRMEPLVCDVCGLPGRGLHLCTGGHLAHEHCLAPRCIDCKRAYCQLCIAQISECAVCHQPVCQKSLIHCQSCKRETCRVHQNLCHAADGKPVDLATLNPEPEPELVSTPAPEPSPSPSRTAKSRSSPHSKSRARQLKGSRPAGQAPLTKGVRMHVEIAEDEPLITAYVMRSTKRVWATRSLRLTSEGISIRCECEKSPCAASGYIYRPVGANAIATQLEGKLKMLRQEYRIPLKKVTYYYIHGPRMRESNVFILPEVWKNESSLAEARIAFDRLPR